MQLELVASAFFIFKFILCWFFGPAAGHATVLGLSPRAFSLFVFNTSLYDEYEYTEVPYIIVCTNDGTWAPFSPFSR